MKTKVCARCKKRKPVEKFSTEPRKKNGVASYCKACLKEYLYARRRAQKAKIDLIKAVPCLDCGSEFPPEVMEFDHVRGKKSFTISQMYAFYKPWKVVQEELRKCDLVCANCHRIRTKRRKEKR